MPGKPVPPLPPAWHAWIAYPVNSPGSPPQKPGRFDKFACFGANVVFLCLVAALSVAFWAILDRRATVLWWLLGGHLPFFFEGLRIVLRIRRYNKQRRKLQAEPPHLLQTPLRLFIVAKRASSVSETGIALADRRFLGWDRIAGFRYHGEWDGYFALQLRPHAAASSVRQGEGEARGRHRLRMGALWVPSAVTLLALVVGAHSFGWRPDVVVALLLSAAHVLVGSAWARLALRRRMAPDAVSPPFFLVFDSREVSAQDVLKRFERYLPWEGSGAA